MDVPGRCADAFLQKVGDFETVETSPFTSTAQRQAMTLQLSAMKVAVKSTTSGTVDNKLRTLIKALDKAALKSGKTIVLHLVAEEEKGTERRHFWPCPHLSRHHERLRSTSTRWK